MRSTGLRALAVAAALALPTAAAAAGCAGPAGHECTLIGCEDGVTVEIGRDVLAGVPGGVTVRTCVDHDCREQAFRPGSAQRGLLTAVAREGLEPGRDVNVTVEITDENGALVVAHTEPVALEEVQPNGPGCPPVCTVGAVRLGELPAP